MVAWVVRAACLVWLLGTSPVRAESPALPTALDLEVVERVSGVAHAGLPVVVAVHGLGDKPERFADLFLRYPQALRLLLPRAPSPWGDGGTWFPRLAAGLEDPALSQGIRAAADRVAAWLRDWQRAHPDAPRPVITGFSQGGILAFALALQHPELVAGAVPVGGLLPPALWPTGPRSDVPPVRALHGADDQRVPTAGAAATVAALKAAGVDAELETFPGLGHSVDAALRVRLYDLIEQLGTESPVGP